jgi:hypothetical protein
VEVQRWTDDFPLGLTVSNTGGKTAEKVTLRVITPRNFGIVVNDLDRYKYNRQLIYTAKDQKIMTEIILGDIHPKETLHLDNIVYGRTENILDIPVNARSADNIPLTMNISMAATFEIQVELSAKDYQASLTNFYVSIGSPDKLRESKHVPFFEVKGNQLLLRK